MHSCAFGAVMSKMHLPRKAIEAGARAIDPDAWRDTDNLTPTEREVWEAAKLNRQRDALECAEACLTAALAAEGVVLVPREPTQAMIDAAFKSGFEGDDDHIRQDYRAMISAYGGEDE